MDTKILLYVDMDDTVCDYAGAHADHRARNPGIAFPQSQYGFFSGLKPLPGAVEAMKYLLESEDYDPYILTAPSLKNPMSYTEKRVWVENHLGFEFVERLIICPNKALLRGHCLIDDCHKGKGQEGFAGELIHFGSEDFPNWKVVMAYLQQCRNNLGKSDILRAIREDMSALSASGVISPETLRMFDLSLTDSD